MKGRIGWYEFSNPSIRAITSVEGDIELVGDVGREYVIKFKLADVKGMARHFGFELSPINTQANSNQL